MVAGKLTYPIGLATVCVFKGYCQHLISLQTGLQRDITQSLVQRIFRRIKQTRRSQFLVVGTTRKMGIEDGRSLVDVTGSGIGGRQFCIQDIIIIVRQGRLSLAFTWMTFCQIRKCENITCIRGRSRFVGHPNLDTADVNTRHQVGQLLHGGIIVLTEVVCQEEVAVLLIVGHVNLEGCKLRAPLRRYTLGGRILLRHHRLQFQFAKLHVRTNTEQTGCALHQRVVGWEGDVTSLYQFDDFVLLTLVAQLQVLGIEVERSISVVVQVHVHLIAHLTIDVQIDFLVKVDALGFTVTFRQ